MGAIDRSSLDQLRGLFFAVYALRLAVALELHLCGAVTALVASDRNLCEVAAAEGIQVVNSIQGL